MAFARENEPQEKGAPGREPGTPISHDILTTVSWETPETKKPAGGETAGVGSPVLWAAFHRPGDHDLTFRREGPTC